MKKNLLFLLFSGCLTSLFGFSLPQKSSIRADLVLPSIIKCEFSHAISTVDSIIMVDPTDPFPYILKLTILGMRDIDCDKTLDSAGFQQTYKYAYKFSDSLEKASGKTSYSRMLIGFSKAMHSAFYLRNKAYFPAMQHGFDALDALNEARKIDSTNTETLMFSGLYDFARAELRAKMWWVLFWFPGDRTSGIEKLRNSSINSTLSKTAAKLSLTEIYIKEKDFRRADSLLNELEKNFPDSRFVLWSRVKFFESQNLFQQAAGVYKTLSHSYESYPDGRYNFFATKLKAAEMLKNAGLSNDVVIVCTSLLSQPDVKNYREFQRSAKRLLEQTQSAESKS